MPANKKLAHNKSNETNGYATGKTESAHCVGFKGNCFSNPLHNRSSKNYKFTKAPSLFIGGHMRLKQQIYLFNSHKKNNAPGKSRGLESSILQGRFF
ncbi:hypothetical protein [Cardinium endosymbiont of Sogatella furcifera]|uniref:hypothetical protein n=1 Tax=Cardinium endosymbiont of Sogatella furcifera TaxID=650378 RepID=UPI000E0DFC0F|nr:hypothetical protein [Cardinium endosymbiont of Sogatella furcifera]